MSKCNKYFYEILANKLQIMVRYFEYENMLISRIAKEFYFLYSQLRLKFLSAPIVCVTEEAISFKIL